jgi:hypothetical protein
MERLWRAVATAFLAIPLALGASQPAGNPLAKVTVAGKEAGTVTADDGKKKDRYVLLEIDQRTTIQVATSQDVTKFSEEILAQHDKLIKAFTAKAKALAEKNDIEGLKKAEKDLNVQSDELLKNLGNLAADGTITANGADLRLDGKLRIYDFKDLDKDLGKGKSRVEGEATQIKYDAGLGEKTMLAIQNGARAIVLTGKAADEHLQAKGVIRALGVLRIGKNGHTVLEVDRVDGVRK